MDKISEEFMTGTLRRIAAANPEFYAFVYRELEKPSELGGIWDSIVSGAKSTLSKVGDEFGTLLNTAASKYGDSLLNKQASKAAKELATIQADAQIADMNAQLELELQRAANDAKLRASQLEAQQQLAIAQQQYAAQQNALTTVANTTVSRISGITSSPYFWPGVGIGSAVLLIFALNLKRRKR